MKMKFNIDKPALTHQTIDITNKIIWSCGGATLELKGWEIFHETICGCLGFSFCVCGL